MRQTYESLLEISNLPQVSPPAVAPNPGLLGLCGEAW